MKTSLLFCRPAQGCIALLTLLILTSLTGYSQTKFYVTTSGGAVTKDGFSWTTAYDATQLQTAIEAASTYSQSHSDEDVQVWVAIGIYKPTTGADRTISFSMRNHVAMYGGFEGDEMLLSDRPTVDLSTPSSTTLSGEINAAGMADNSYHVINNSGLPSLTTSAVIDGFVITGGNADSAVEEADMSGGGMTNPNSSPTVRNCHFVMNAAKLGGAMYNLASSGGTSSPVITNCAFTGNSAGPGGAMYNFADFGTSSPVITNCSFTGNTSNNGGGLYNGISGGGSCSPVINTCSFTGNSSTSNSGVIANDGGSPKVTNCSFTGNSADRGGVSLNYTVQTFTNCSFSGNTSVQGGGVSYQTSGTTTFKNCSFWNNGGALTFFNVGTATIVANYCLFEPTVANYTGANNLTTAVLPFVSATDLQLTACSPAINAGDPGSTTLTSGTTDLTGNPRFYNSGIVDIGAFEFQGELPSPPVISSAGESSLTVGQNTPVSLTITGCETGSLNWQGTNATSGTGAAIAVPTATVGTIIYSATCTVGSCPSQPGSATVTITPASVSGSFDGYIYGADCGSFRGWAWDRNKINTVVSVDIRDGASLIATIPAGDFRQDLFNAGKGNGKHAFSFVIPDALKDNLPHTLTAQVTGNGFILKDSPKALICQNSLIPVGNQPPVPPTPTVLIAPLVAQENVPFSGTLVAFTDPEGSTLTYALNGLPTGLALDATSRVISGTPTQVGTFLLTYSATDGPGSTNSVSFNLTVLPEPSSAVTGDFDGYLDKLDCGGIRGWVWDRNKPNTPFTVEFYTETSPGDITVLGSTLANIYRTDLKDAGKGNGAHAYNFTAPPGLTNGTQVRARVLGNGFILKGSPKTYQCSPARLSAESGSDLQVMVLGNPVTDQIQVEIHGAESQLLRLQLTDVSGRLISEQQIEKAKAVEQHTLSTGKLAPGLLLLRVNTPAVSKTVKVLKTN